VVGPDETVAGMRSAAIDCGTNSIRLLVVDLDDSGRVTTELDRRMAIVRLGQGVDATGRLSAAALERTFAACADFAGVLDGLHPDRLRFVATSATRDAANRDEFIAGVRARLGVEPEVITGAEEAQLSFAGAISGLTLRAGDADTLAGGGAAGPVLVVDIGGGSTEFVVGPPPGLPAGPIRGFSTDIGCVRLTERHLHDDPPTAAQLAAATADIDAALAAAAAAVPLDTARRLVGVAGSVTTVAAAVLGLPAYDSSRIHLARLPVPDVIAACGGLIGSTREQRAGLPFMHPGRVDVIGAGALILRRVLERVGPQLDPGELVVSEHDILDGIAAGAPDPSAGRALPARRAPGGTG
jgi:exopolyphosphatase/guanosine-5'-triphosphate,3'-diphosphate pyrophosphatase